MSDFLLEIGLDEIPARMIASAEAELGRRVNDLLTRERLLAEGATVTTYSTPRRLAVLAQGILAAQVDSEEQLTGPSWKIAFQEGAPTPAAVAFAKKAGVEVSKLAKVTTPKGEYVGATVKRTGRAASEILVSDLPKEVLSLYWAKTMYWRADKPERFVRPVRWVVALLDAAVVPLEIAGITAGNTSRGHRILHGDSPVVIPSPTSYAEALKAAKVVVDVAERRQIIRKALDKATRTIPGAKWREDEPLVETVTHLTEWPSVILGNFDPAFLTLPEEVLVTVMRDHQKYFAVEDADGKLAPHFLAVLNTEADEEGNAIIRHGNQKVLVARFKDAQFFWDFDQKTPLTERLESLKNVTFHKELGSYSNKTTRLVVLTDELSDVANKSGSRLDKESLLLAAKLAKADLTSELVKEFTELQGIIGGLYARHQSQGHGDVVWQTIYSQYQPESMEDKIPTIQEGQLLAIADKVDTITGIFGIGLPPTGSKDPFALRRAANGIVKILAEGDLPLNLTEIVDLSLDQYRLDLFPAWKTPRKELKSEISGFFKERLHFYLKDVKGFAYDVVNAVLAAGSDDVRDAIARAEALTEVRGSEDFAAVSAAFKRIRNILKQAEEKGFEVSAPDRTKLAPEAHQLAVATYGLTSKVAKLRESRSYKEALSEIATLRPAVDAFFDKVMVLDSDPVVRSSNLGLIRNVEQSFSGIADFSEIVTA